MPDLGPYAIPVLSAYAVTLALIAGLIGLSVWRSRKVRADLQKLEEGRDG